MLAVLFGLRQAASNKSEVQLTAVVAFPAQILDHTIGILLVALEDTPTVAMCVLASLKAGRTALAGYRRCTLKIPAATVVTCSGWSTGSHSVGTTDSKGLRMSSQWARSRFGGGRH